MDTVLNNDTLQKFITESKIAFRELFNAAKQRDELQFAQALSAEFRPYKANTALDAHRAYFQYLEFLKSGDYPLLRPRVALSFYCHIAEASGYWEIVKNMLSVANGNQYDSEPFRKFVNTHAETGKLILPNANKIIKSLVGLASEIGQHKLVDVLKVAFDSGIRNAYAHADYVIIKDGIIISSRYSEEYTIKCSSDASNRLLPKNSPSFSLTT